MNELSCKVVIGLVEMSERKGIQRGTLLSGHRHTPEHLMDGRHRTDWTVGMEILRRMREEAGSREAYLGLADSWGSTPGYAYVRRFATHLFDPLQLYTYPEKVVTKMNLSCVEWSWIKTADRALEGLLTTMEGYPANDAFWDIHLAVKRKMPALLGLPDAEVEITEKSEHHAKFRIVLPPSGTLWARMWRFLRIRKRWEQITTEDAGVKDRDSATSASSAVTMDLPFSTPRGNEVSCRVVIGLVELGEAGGISRDKILAGFRHSPGHLLDPKNRTDWPTAHEVLLRLRREAGSREAFLELAERYGSTPAYRYIQSIASLIFSPLDLFTFPNAVVIRMNFASAWHYTWKKLSNREIRFTYATMEGHHGSEELWEFQRIAMAKLPRLLGLQDAAVEIESIDRDEATYRAMMPPSGTLGARVARFLRMHGTSPDPAFAIFAQQHEDIRRSYEVLNATERERADLARDLLRVADKEREHFAREIHDGLGQELVAIKFQLEHLAHQADGPVSAQAAKLAELMTNTHQLARSLARSYDPILGAGGDFGEAIGKLAAHYEGKATFILSGMEGLVFDPEKGTHLYRVAQEAVNNALRHGRASRITISFQTDGKQATFTVEDNGTGKDVPAQPSGMGLRTMQYRAGEIGGKLECCPREEGGIRMACIFPMSNANVARSSLNSAALPLLAAWAAQFLA